MMLTQRMNARPNAAARISVRARATAQVITRTPVAVAQDAPVELDVEALHRRLEARAKAMIALEEQEVATRTKVKFVLAQKVGLGEAWKVVGKCPELGNFLPEVAPYMKWNNGDVWTLELPVRAGSFAFKAVLRKPDGMYLWEEGPDRTLEVGYAGGNKEIKITNVKFPGV